MRPVVQSHPSPLVEGQVFEIDEPPSSHAGNMSAAPDSWSWSRVTYCVTRVDQTGFSEVKAIKRRVLATRMCPYCVGAGILIEDNA